MALVPTKVASFDLSSAIVESNGQVNVVDKSLIPSDVMAEVNKSMATINFKDQTSLTNFGADAQKSMASASAGILATVKTKDTGDVGTMLTGLVKNIKDIDCKSLGKSADKGFIGNLFNRIKDPLQTFMIKQKSVFDNIDVIVKDLEKKRGELITSIKTLDGMYDKNLEYFKGLQIAIVAGFVKLREERETVLAELEAKATETKDPSDIQKFTDYKNLLTRFEKRLHDMVTARHVAMLTGPSIRTMQNNNALLAEEIQNSILTAVPALQQQIVLAIEAYKSRQALESQKLIKDTTNDLLKSNSELLKQTSIEVATMAQQTLIEFDTVVTMQENLLSSIDSVKQIEEEGRKKREAEVQQLIQKENELKDRIMKQTSI